MKYDAIVVGGGISGLLSALALSKEGKKVIMFEKNSYIGGNVRSYDVDGYTVDTGPHAITEIQKGPLTRLMKMYGDGMPEMVSHRTYYFRTKDGLYPVPASIEKLLKFNAISAKDKLIFSKVLTSEIIKGTIPNNNANQCMYDIIKNHDISENALKLVDTLCYFLSGTSMKETPSKRMFAGFSMEGINGLGIIDCCYALKRLFIAHNVSKGQMYPKGGVGKITSAIVDSFPEDMVDIVTKTPVEKIIIEDGKAVGVECYGEIYNSDIIVYTGFVKDLGQFVDEKMPPKFEGKLKKIKQAKSYTLWLGLKEKLFEMDYMGSEIWFESGEPFWAMPTSNLDESLAPYGKQLVAFTFIVREDNLKKTKKNAWDTITSVFPDIESKIEMKHEQVTIPEKAAITVDSFFSGPCSPFENLYLAGTDTDPRSMGITRAAYSVEEMLKVLKSKELI
ncbi:MAG: NAD(P)/FAD-dependent oxidoreductase [archaeon]|nr:NAD(P)/FAD-dependent oxidoreductase [archaeon]